MSWFQFPDDKGELYNVFFPIHWTRNVSDAGDVSTFLKPTIGIASHTNAFDKDLTGLQKFDEVVVATLSLLLLLTVEAILATILLRTTGGNVSLFGFSVNKFVELTRGFRFRHMAQQKERNIRVRLFIASFAVLLFSFVTGVTVLTLTSREGRGVTNAKKTFELLQPFIPDWNAVRNDSLNSINRPCTVMSLLGARQGGTTMNTCLLSSLSPIEFEAFKVAEDEVNITIISDIHKYGAEHEIIIGEDSAVFSMRAYFSLSDHRVRILKQRTIFRNRARDMRVVHKNYVGYLFSAYERATNDSRMSFERLKELYLEDFTTENGPLVDITQIGNGTGVVRTESTRHITKARGIIPQGIAALRFGQSLFKASTAVAITIADEDDLFENEGEWSTEAIVWRDTARDLNWLSLLILLLGALCILFVLRLFLKPIATQDVAGVLVSRAADEEAEREAFKSNKEPSETRYVRVSSLSEEREYRYGAETSEDVGAAWIREEYQEKPEIAGHVPYM